MDTQTAITGSNCKQQCLRRMPRWRIRVQLRLLWGSHSVVFPRTVALDAVLWPTGQGGCLLGVWNGSAAALDRSQLMLDE